MVGHGGSSAGSYLADPTSPIPSHCASIVVTSTLRVKPELSMGLCIQGNQCKLVLTPFIIGQLDVSNTQWLKSLVKGVNRGCPFLASEHGYFNSKERMSTLKHT